MISVRKLFRYSSFKSQWRLVLWLEISSEGTEESPTDALNIPLFPRELDLWHAKRLLPNRLSGDFSFPIHVHYL